MAPTKRPLIWQQAPTWIEGRPLRSVSIPVHTSKGGGFHRPWAQVMFGAIALDPDLVRLAQVRNAGLVEDGRHLDIGAPVPELDHHERQVAAVVSQQLAHRGVCPSLTRFEVMGAAFVDFHVDEGFGSPGVLFSVISLMDGGDLLFPNLGLRIPFPTGAVVTFDPLQPHGVVASGSDEQGSASVFCLSIDMQFDPLNSQRLGLIARKPGPEDLLNPVLGSDGLWKERGRLEIAS